MDKELLFIDMDGVMADFHEKAERLISERELNNNNSGVDKVSRLPGFYSDLLPIEGAIDAFKLLSEHYEVYLLSTAAWTNPSSWTDKRLWVEKHLGKYGYKRLILSHNKGLFKGRALIDDRLKNGVTEFQGEHIHFGQDRFPDWKSVLEYLIPNN